MSHLNTRLVIAKRYDEPYHPFVIGAINEDTFECLEQDEWDELRRAMAEQWLGGDEGSYEFLEIIVSLSSEDLVAMFATRCVAPEKVSLAEDQS